MLFSLKDLIASDQYPISVLPSDTIDGALERMKEHDFSQLPVVDSSGTASGDAVTPESILDAIRYFKTTSDTLVVSDAVIRAPKFRSDSDLLQALDDIERHSFVLVVDAGDKLTGIVTTSDTTSHFRKYAEDLMIVQFIETTLKEAIQSLYRDDPAGLQGGIDKVSDRNKSLKKGLSAALCVYLAKTGHKSTTLDPEAHSEAWKKLKLPDSTKKFNDLGFDEFKELLLGHPKGPKLSKSDGITEVRTLLSDVRDVRNKLAHFRGDLNATERKSLRFAANWLERSLPSAPPVVVPEEPGSAPETIVPAGEIIRATDSVYAPLADYLQALSPDAKSFPLTFGEIEVLIGTELPKSALEYRSWWANDPERSHSAQWLAAGWRAQSVKMSARCLTFARTGERQDAYIRFFSRVRKALQRIVDFPLSDLSPQGQPWQTLAEFPWKKGSSAILNASFLHSKQLRIEVYIDCGEAILNKQKFDQLLQHKRRLEDAIGEKLTWERMERYRGSRIACYRPAHILEDKKDLDASVSWIVNQAEKFHPAFLPLFEETGSAAARPFRKQSV